MPITNKQIYNAVSHIPKGKVATYGQIAKLVGYPNHSRYIGRVLSQLEYDNDIPWHRVVNAKGKISPRGFDGCDDYQKILLEEEGVIFNDKNCISLKEFQWETNIQNY